MADAKIITYGKDIGAGTTVIPDNQVALDIESTDAKAYVQINTTDSAEKLTLAGGGATIELGSASSKTATGGASAMGAEGGSLTISTGDSTETAGHADADDLVIESDGNSGINIISGSGSGTTNYGALLFGRKDGEWRGGFNYQHGSANDYLQFWTAGALALKIDKDKKIMTGGETTSLGGEGGSLHVRISDSSGTVETGCDDLILERAGGPGLVMLMDTNLNQSCSLAYRRGTNNMFFTQSKYDSSGHTHFMVRGMRTNSNDTIHLQPSTVSGDLPAVLLGSGNNSMVKVRGYFDKNLSDSTSVVTDGGVGTNRYVESTAHGLHVNATVRLGSSVFSVATRTDADNFILDGDFGSTGDQGQCFTDPTLFQVNSGDDKEFFKVDNNGTGVFTTFEDTIKIGGSEGAKVSFARAGGVAISATHGSGELYLQAGGGANRVKVDSNGDVGINTTNPTAKLHVISSASESLLTLSQTGDHQDTTLSVATASEDRGPAAFFATHASFADGGNYGVLRIDAKPASGTGFALISASANDGADLKFKVRGDGAVSADAAYSGSGADYSEYFETADGQPIAAGSSVVLDGDKVRLANAGEQPIGVVRPVGSSSVVGNDPWNHWKGRYLRDDFGGYVVEPYTVTSWSEEVVESSDIGPDISRSEHRSFATDRIPDGVVVPSGATVSSADKHGKALERRVENPDYDESLQYVSREDRDEWVIVGLLGQVPISKGQPLADGWVKMRDVSASVEFYFIK